MTDNSLAARGARVAERQSQLSDAESQRDEERARRRSEREEKKAAQAVVDLAKQLSGEKVRQRDEERRKEVERRQDERVAEHLETASVLKQTVYGAVVAVAESLEESRPEDASAVFTVAAAVLFSPSDSYALFAQGLEVVESASQTLANYLEEGRSFENSFKLKLIAPLTPSSSSHGSGRSQADEGPEKDLSASMHSLRLHTPELSSSDSSSDSNGSDGEDLTITIPLAAVPLSQQRDPEDNLDEDEGRVGTKFRRRVLKVHFGMCPAVETIDEDVHLYAKDNFHLVDIPSNYYEDKVVAMHILRAASRNCDSSFWSILNHFCGPDHPLQERYRDGNNIMKTANGLVGTSEFHQWFDDFEVSLKPIRDSSFSYPATYQCQVHWHMKKLDQKASRNRWPSTITLRNHHPLQNHVLTDPDVLDLHHALTLVHRAKGGAAQIDEVLRARRLLETQAREVREAELDAEYAEEYSAAVLRDQLRKLGLGGPSPSGKAKVAALEQWRASLVL